MESLRGKTLLKITVLVLGSIFLSLAMTSIGFGQNVQLSIPASSGPKGEEVLIPINISDTTGRGIISVDMTLQYDTLALGIVDEDPSTAWFDGVVDTSGTIIPSGSISLVSEIAPGRINIMIIFSPLSGSGVFVKIKFLAQPTGNVGATYPISFTAALLNDGTPGALTQNGTFTPEPGEEPERIPGDANGDDRVNHLDLLKAILSYGKSSGDNGFDANADFDGDGHVNRYDVIILWRNFGATKQ